MLPTTKLLQQACLAQLEYDESINVLLDLEFRWRQWFKSLPNLQQVSVPKWFLLRRKKCRRQLYAFLISAHLVMELVYIFAVFMHTLLRSVYWWWASPVLPLLKRVTVPRSKIAAAVLSPKLCSIVQNEMDFNFSRVCPWTDASVVLRYILNSSLQFDTFVANRIEQLHTMISLTSGNF